MEPEPERQTQRLEAFSDGVFAIAITLLVLEIRMPNLQADGRHASLAGALLHEWPSYFAYAFSFLMIGIYWANHHYICRFYVRVDHWFLLLNLLFLMCISFLPFPSEVLSTYAAVPGAFPASVRLYEIGLLLPALSWMLVWLYAASGRRLIDRKLAEPFVRRLTTQYIASTGIYAIAIIVGIFSPAAGLAIALILTISYLMPPKKPEYGA